jgi:hypothetical protein
MCEQDQSQENLPPFEQCKHSVVTVSQTKMGVCLQFFWHPDTAKSDKYYCSIDLIPTFKMVKVEALELANIVNTSMIQQQPVGWLRYLKKYVISDLVLTDLLDPDQINYITNCLLKQLNSGSDCYYVRPGQHLGVNKFSTEAHHKVYCKIKALKTILKVDLSQYMVKKILLRPSECIYDDPNIFMYSTMSQSEIKEQFQSQIDYDQWDKAEFKSMVPLKKYVTQD